MERDWRALSNPPPSHLLTQPTPAPALSLAHIQTNSSYDRWYEARRQWGVVTSALWTISAMLACECVPCRHMVSGVRHFGRPEPRVHWGLDGPTRIMLLDMAVRAATTVSVAPAHWAQPPAQPKARAVCTIAPSFHGHTRHGNAPHPRAARTVRRKAVAHKILRWCVSNRVWSHGSVFLGAAHAFHTACEQAHAHTGHADMGPCVPHITSPDSVHAEQVTLSASCLIAPQVGHVRHHTQALHEERGGG